MDRVLQRGIIQRMYDWSSLYKKHREVPVPIVVSRCNQKTNATLSLFFHQALLCEEIRRENESEKV